MTILPVFIKKRKQQTMKDVLKTNNLSP